MRPTTSLAIALLAVLALAGCGRRGPLELPPGAPAQPAAQAASTPNSVPGNQVARTPGQKQSDIFSEGTVPRPINAPPQPKTGFFLDPLL